MQRKVTKRKVVQRYRGLSLRYAEGKLTEKAKKEQEKEKKKQDREFKKLLNIEKKMVHDQGVEDRKAEKERKKRVRELAGQEVPPELLIPILDREKEWKEARQIQAQLAQEAKEKEEEEEEVVSFTIDTQGDRSLVPAFNPLQQDLLAFPSSPPEGSQWWKEASISACSFPSSPLPSCAFPVLPHPFSG
jgi:hypothetical protein